MSDKKVHTYARVRVTIDVPLSQPWGGDEKAETVFNRARNQAREEINRLLDNKYPIVDMKVITTISEEG